MKRMHLREQNVSYMKDHLFIFCLVWFVLFDNQCQFSENVLCETKKHLKFATSEDSLPQSSKSQFLNIKYNIRDNNKCASFYPIVVWHKVYRIYVINLETVLHKKFKYFSCAESLIFLRTEWLSHKVKYTL